MIYVCTNNFNSNFAQNCNFDFNLQINLAKKVKRYQQKLDDF